MIDATAITRFDRTPAELEEFAIFCVLSSMQSGLRAAEATNGLMAYCDSAGDATAGPFARLTQALEDEHLTNLVRQARSRGQVQALLSAKHTWPTPRALRAVLAPVLAGLPVRFPNAKAGSLARLLAYPGATNRLILGNRDEVAKLPGFGLKTASMFVLHSRPNQRVAALDRHILRFLAAEFPDQVTSTAAPTTRGEYLRLEDLFLKVADRMGVAPCDLDLDEWRRRAVGVAV